MSERLEDQVPPSVSANRERLVFEAEDSFLGLLERAVALRCDPNVCLHVDGTKLHPQVFLGRLARKQLVEPLPKDDRPPLVAHSPLPEGNGE